MIFNFMKGSSAIAIGLLIAAAFTFPVLVIGIIVGWYFIEQEVSVKED